MMSGGYYGLRVYYCNNLDVYHNTAVGSYAGLYDYYNGATVDIRNNIFQGGTYALYDYNSSAVQDYNLYYSTGTSLAYIYNGSFSYPTDLATLIAADTTNNLSSVVGDPIFASASDLHVYGPLANDVGDNTTGITVDIDGDTRPMSGSTVVDMGADEFDVAQDDAALNHLYHHHHHHHQPSPPSSSVAILAQAGNLASPVASHRPSRMARGCAAGLLAGRG